MKAMVLKGQVTGMKNERIRKLLTLIVVLALTASLLWTFFCIKPEPVAPSQQISVKFSNDYSIISGKDLSIWPKGTVFEPGGIAYFYAAEPLIKVTPVVRLYGLVEGKIFGSVKSQVYIQAVNDKVEVYWSYPLIDIPQKDFSFTAHDPDQNGSHEFAADEITIDAVYANDLVAGIGEELSFRTGQFQLAVESELHLSGSVDENNIDKKLSNILTFVLQQASFSAPKQNDVTTEATLTQIPETPALNERVVKELVKYPYPFILDMVLLILIFVLIFRKKEESNTALQHKRFKEWITEGSVDPRGKYSINVFSLEGLVDLAIDMDRRVIFDPKVRKYYVMEENMLYVYDPEHNKALVDNKEQIGKLLVKRGIISPEQLETGLFYQQRVGGKLGESLIALGFLNETTLYCTLAAQLGFDYFELHENTDTIDKKWIDVIGVERARIFQVMPLGNRADGKLVVACGDVSRQGLNEALEELFHNEVYIVAAKPSAIYGMLNYIQKSYGNYIICDSPEDEGCLIPAERLSKQEREEFKESYYRGNVMYDLLLKASGKADSFIIEQASRYDNILNWMVNNNIVNDEFVNLLKGLSKIVESMDSKNRRENQIPELTEILLKANYLTNDTMEWIHNEFNGSELPIEDFMKRNYLVSEETIDNAVLILKTLRSILQ